jgi:AcrR family transcriptional regulator
MYEENQAERRRAVPPIEEIAIEDKGEPSRRAILDATVACLVEYGWHGANMSVIARRARMTRGRIQYYFPTLQDLQAAAIEYLLAEWRNRYVQLVANVSGASERFEMGIDALWLLARDPLHVAKQELEASARTDPELRALMLRATERDDEASVEEVKRVYPELAEHGDEALRMARDFTLVFIEGLSLYRFGPGAETRRPELLDMLKTVLASYWSALGVEGLRGEPLARAPLPSAPRPSVLRDDDRDRALALIKEATDLLSTRWNP